MPSHLSCGCSASLRQPKPNGTCAACGGWLPGEQPAGLPWTVAPPEFEAEIREQNRDLEAWDV